VPAATGPRRCPAPNPPGAHFLDDPALIRRLVRASGAGPGQLALDLGAGHGALTAALAAAGPRVIAVERDPGLARGLRRRMAGRPLVTVLTADLREIPLPHRDFLVVANIPFAVGTAVARRLAGDPSVPLAGAELIIGWGTARTLTAPVPRSAELAWWAARYEFRLVSRVPPGSFTPPPRVAAAHLSARPRPLAHARGAQAGLRRMLAAAYRHPSTPAIHVLSGLTSHRGQLLSPRTARRALIEAGAHPAAAAATLTAAQWHDLAMRLAGGDGRGAAFPGRTT
jgi:23S rRNA (adenine-N6)-dimethyltransferase